MPSTNGHGPKRAILYARVSTDEQARSGYSLAQQLEALRDYASREGYEVLEEVQDPGQSGTSLERPGMDRVRDLVAAGGILQKPPQTLSNLLAASLAAQLATAPIIAASFDEVSIIGALTNLIAVPISGPILTLGMLGSLVGNVAPALAYPLNASNGFLVAVLEWVARTASAFPFATVGTSGVTMPLIWLFYAGCIPAAISERAFPEERWALWGALLVSWTALWLALVGAGSV